ncbi:hypothetical protein MCUN1_001322 [Malassezia cuniculi]|uniref:Cation/H+ exchanger transmembrane domain-containing protein n=1 Tax=Malassezia cuniculi TaxID=948313 RepID=A0AAF0EU92_9BASI|nr:hypothetical protein MCUN1_001322 [Malassezia cuniculi]
MIDLIDVELSQISKGLAIMGGFIVIYGLVSFIAKERLYLSEPLLAVTVGIIVGPHVLNWVNPFEWSDEETHNETTFQLTRIVIAVQVLFTGIALPKKYLWREKQSLIVLLFIIMTIAWFISALLIWGLIGKMTFLEALCIASCVTPTDPVLANSITSGHFAETHVPENVRRIILAESGANDGLGFPFLFLAVFLLARTKADYGQSVGDEIGRWFYSVICYQVLLSVAYGALMGFVARKSLRWAVDHNLIDMSNFFSYGFGLAMFTVGTAGLFGTDDILACFICGNSFTWDDWFRLRIEEHDFQEIIDMLLNTGIFLYIGTIIPWGDYSNSELGLSGWRLVVLGICVILVRRLPWVMAMYKLIPALHDWKEAAFTGWFGPIGVGAIYYIEVALREVPDDDTRTHMREVINPVVLFCVFSSVLTHGITIPITRFGPQLVRHTTIMTQSSEHRHKHMHYLLKRFRYFFYFWRDDSYWRALDNVAVYKPDNNTPPFGTGIHPHKAHFSQRNRTFPQHPFAFEQPDTGAAAPEDVEEAQPQRTNLSWSDVENREQQGDTTPSEHKFSLGTPAEPATPRHVELPAVPAPALSAARPLRYDISPQ